jgi:hypothetical protein
LVPSLSISIMTGSLHSMSFGVFMVSIV